MSEPVGIEIKGTDIRVEISDFRGKTRVDFRRWYNDKTSGELARTSKGLNVTLEEWELIKETIPEITNYIKER